MVDLQEYFPYLRSYITISTTHLRGNLTLPDNGGQVYNVKAFGAKGDATTNDASSINLAIQSANAAGGGVVFFPPGRYKIGAYITPLSNVTLLGTGASSELFRTTADYIINSTTGGSTFHDFTVDNLMFTGTITNTPSVPTRNRNVSTGGSIGGPEASEAIIIFGSLDTGGSYPVITNVILRRCIFRNISSLPILITGITGVTKVVDCEFTNNYDAGFKFNQEVIFSNNHMSNSGDNGVSISRGNLKVTCVGNTIENCAYHGIWLAGFNSDSGPQYISCTGNVIRNVGYSGIVLNDGGKYATISNNFIDKQYVRGPVDSISNSHVYGIELDGDTNNVVTPSKFNEEIVVSGNVIKGAPRAGILIRSAKNIVVTGNLFADFGSQYNADGVTAILSNDTGSNNGVYFPTTTNLTNIQIFNNCFIDSRNTPYGNYAITPYPTTGVTAFNNYVQGLRNSPTISSQFSGGELKARTTVADAAYPITTADHIIEYTSLTAGRTATLPTAVGVPGQVYIIKDGAGNANTFNITLATTGGQTIDGAATKTINSSYGILRVYSNGTNWLTF